MANELMQFGFQGQDVRVYLDHDENLWFSASDVCRVLEISNVSDAVGRLDSDEKSDGKGIGKTDTGLIINESGLYTLTIRSNKPQAKPFRRWVTHEVLPQIRKTGNFLDELFFPQSKQLGMDLASDQDEPKQLDFPDPKDW